MSFPPSLDPVPCAACVEPLVEEREERLNIPRAKEQSP